METNREKQPVNFYDLPFWMEMGLEDKHQHFKRMITDTLFAPVAIPFKVATLHHNLLTYTRRLAEELKLRTQFERFNDSSHQKYIATDSLERHIQEFNVQLAPLKDPVFPDKLLVSPRTSLPKDQEAFLFTLDMIDASRFWVNAKLMTCVRWVTSPVPDAMSPHPMLRLEKTSTFVDEPYFARREQLIVLYNGDMFLLKSMVNPLHLTHGVKVAFHGTVTINEKGKLREITPDDSCYPIEDRHTDAMVSHLEKLGLFLFYCKIHRLPSTNNDQALSPKAQRTRRSPRFFAKTTNGHVAHTDQHERLEPVSESLQDYAEYLGELLEFVSRHVREPHRHQEFTDYAQHYIELFEPLPWSHQLMHDFLATIFQRIFIFKRKSGLAEKEIQQFDQLTQRAPWSLIKPKKAPTDNVQVNANLKK